MSVKLNCVSVAFGDNKVLDNVSLDFGDKGVVALSGPSGCGKTTVLRLLAGLLKPDSGEIVGTEGKKIAYVFQEARLFPWLTMLENVMVIDGDKNKAEALLCQLGFDESQFSLYPGEMSGGMKQRVSIARALMIDSDILLVDEPFASLDDANVAAAEALLYKRRNEQLIIMVSHDSDRLTAADRVIKLA